MRKDSRNANSNCHIIVAITETQTCGIRGNVLLGASGNQQDSNMHHSVFISFTRHRAADGGISSGQPKDDIDQQHQMMVNHFTHQHNNDDSNI